MALFALALLAFCALPAAMEIHSTPQLLLLGVAVAACAAALLRWQRQPPTLTLEDGVLSDGRARVGVAGTYACAFAARGPVAMLREGLSLDPEIEVLTVAGVVGFRPDRYDRLAGAHLARALAAGAASGDARGWLLARFPAPPPGTEAEPPTPALSPVTIGALVLLYGFFGLFALLALARP